MSWLVASHWNRFELPKVSQPFEAGSVAKFSVNVVAEATPHVAQRRKRILAMPGRGLRRLADGPMTIWLGDGWGWLVRSRGRHNPSNARPDSRRAQAAGSGAATTAKPSISDLPVKTSTRT